MRKGFIIIFFVSILISISFISAVEFSMKDSYMEHETLLAKISGNFLQGIQDQNVRFYRQNVYVPVEFEIQEIAGDYYLYAMLGDKVANNYSIVIKNTEYYSGEDIISDDLVKNFTIVAEKAPFKIKPGYFITKENISIQVQNLMANSIVITLNKKDSSEGVAESKSFFDVLFGTGDKPVNESEITQKTYTLKSGEIKDIDIKLTLSLEDVWRTITLSSKNLTYEIPVYQLASTLEEVIEANITINQTYNNTVLNQTTNTTNNQTKPLPEIKSKTCAQINGTFCTPTSTKKCVNNSIIVTKDGKCCITQCADIPATSTAKIIGWLMILVILIGIIWFVKVKYLNKIRKPINLLKSNRPKEFKQ
jgi:hypothetical protein